MRIVPRSTELRRLRAANPADETSATVRFPWSAQDAELRVWHLDDFEPRKLLPAGLWRLLPVIEYVVGIVAARPAFNPRCRRERDGWVPLRWVVMDPLFGRHGTWNKVRRLLLDLGVLECDETYVIDEKAKWYRLGPEWLDQGVHLADHSRQTLLARLGAVDGHWVERSAWREPDKHLGRWLREVRVDEAMARPWTCRSRNYRQRLQLGKF